ncbi:DedA family protein [Burkholderia stabilis]|nr:VTT domain-containing protein [Burkholderia stabilis]
MQSEIRIAAASTARRGVPASTHLRDPDAAQGACAMTDLATLAPFGRVFGWIGTNGIACLVALSLIERLVPVLPSHVLLTMIGAGCAQGMWTLPEAVAVTTTGNLAGCLVYYGLGVMWPRERTLMRLQRLATRGRLAPAGMDALIGQVRARPARLALCLQLVPFVRLLAPLLAGLLEVNPMRFIAGTVIGIALWSTLFITAGYLAAQLSAASDTPGMTIMAMLVLVSGLLVAVLRSYRLGRWSFEPDREPTDANP